MELHAYGWKAHQNGWGIWLYTAGICQGSTDFFSFSDDYKIYALWDSKPSPLNEPSPIAVDPDLTLLGQLAASQQPTAPAAAGPRIPCCYPATLFSENSSIRWKCHAILVTHAGLPCTTLTNTVSVFHAWARKKKDTTACLPLISQWRSSLPAHGHWLEGKSRPPIQTV